VRSLPLRWKMLLAYLLTDEAYAVTIIHYTESDSPPATRHWFFLGAGLGLWTTWQLSTAVGIFLGAAIPAGWSLDFALALTFTGIVVPTLRDRPHVGAALSAGLVAVLAAAWPFKLGLMAAALTGIVVGVVLEGWQRPTAAKVIHDEEAA
jgi:predicted branched-subunit amino acid permease